MHAPVEPPGHVASSNSQPSSLPKKQTPFLYRFVSVDDKSCNWDDDDCGDSEQRQQSGGGVVDPLPRPDAATDEIRALPAATRRYALLARFYDELMMRHFPLEDERDDLDDWIFCFEAQRTQRRRRREGRPIKIGTRSLDEDADSDANDVDDDCRGPAMDVILMMSDDIAENDEVGGDDGDSDGDPLGRDRPATIVGGAAVEYYKHARVGLLSYIALSEDYQGRGLARPLHDEALRRLGFLSERYGNAGKVGRSDDGEEGLNSADYDGAKNDPSSDRGRRSLLRAVFAETNTACAGDVSPQRCLARHRSLYYLGYRQLHFPYSQPPLTDKDINGSFDEIMLLVYFPQDMEAARMESSRTVVATAGREREVEELSKKNLLRRQYSRMQRDRHCPWFQNHETNAPMFEEGEVPRKKAPARLDPSIPFDFVEDFYMSVFGYGTTEPAGGSADGIYDTRAVSVGYRESHYYRIASWFASRHVSSDVNSLPPPWIDRKANYREQMEREGGGNAPMGLSQTIKRATL